ncbi:high-affinity Zn(2+) transporter zrt1 [Phytophthora pseudosyringae]|uniref:High-affinity Zn(2+) transporter zrt1 n=1 Tax=Phytophthora pseudosyringae TaxID=221518 RepID=A0A8T1W0K3_9STRA|nr:high-affinity Zn(2+) transporter zrt1 [Phytophthora pseudosyringae]
MLEPALASPSNQHFAFRFTGKHETQDSSRRMEDMGLRVGAIFIILAVSVAGTLVPIVSQKIPQSSTNTTAMEAIRAFSFGVVLSTGLIHMVNEGVEKLRDEALGSIVEDYGCLGLAIVLATLVLLHFIECESVVFFGSQGSVLHGHGHSHGQSNEHSHVHGHESDDSIRDPASTRSVDFHALHPVDSPKPVKETQHDPNIRRKIATIIFEAGVIFHSVIVGLDLGVTTGTEFKTLLTALCFHQFFEGIAISSAALGSIRSRNKLFMVNLAFAITTPIGQVIGIGIRNSYSSESTTALWVQGVFDCVAGGILLYTGLVELLTYNMTTNQKFLSRSGPQRFTLYASLWMGAALMALIGRWA